MNKTRLFLFVVLVAVTAVAWGCGGGDDVPPRITPQWRDDVDQEAQALLVEMPLTPGDLGSGYEQVGASFSSNEEVAGSESDFEEVLAEIEESGRRLGLSVEFQPSAGAEVAVWVVHNILVLYQEPEDASLAMEQAVANARELDWSEIYPDLNDFLLHEVRRSIGDESVWFRASGWDPDDGRVLMDDELTFRMGEVWAFLRVVALHPFATEREALMDDVERWAQTVAGRIASALAEGATD